MSEYKANMFINQTEDRLAKLEDSYNGQVEQVESILRHVKRRARRMFWAGFLCGLFVSTILAFATPVVLAFAARQLGR